MAFFLGRTTEVNERLLHEENALHNDIIQVDFKDAYTNLTFKVASALHWISYNCNHIKWLIKSDDDMFLDMYRFLGRFQEKYENTSRTIFGYYKDLPYENLLRIQRIGKKCNSVWCISHEFFPGKTLYPPHFVGPMIYITGDLIKELYEATFKTQYFWIDDTYFTGMLTQTMSNFSTVDLPYAIEPYVDMCKDPNIPRGGTLYCLAHGTNTFDDFLKFWELAEKVHVKSKKG